MWQFHDFSIAQILREIKFGDSGSAKFAIFTYLEALNFDFYALLHFLRLKLTNSTKFTASNMVKMTMFSTGRFTKIDFTQNLNDRKILKFAHCVELTLRSL